MKKLITMAITILVTACIAAFASPKPSVSMPQRQFDYHLSFSKIVVEDDIDLQLKKAVTKSLKLPVLI